MDAGKGHYTKNSREAEEDEVQRWESDAQVVTSKDSCRVVKDVLSGWEERGQLAVDGIRVTGMGTQTKTTEKSPRMMAETPQDL